MPIMLVCPCTSLISIPWHSVLNNVDCFPQVSVTDLLGGAVPGGVSVTADAIVAEGSGAPIAEGVVLKQVAGGSVFELDVMALKPARGFYR